MGLPPGPGGGHAGWNYGWSPPARHQPRRTIPTAVTALLLAVAVLVGLGIGHGVWRSGAASVASSGGAGNSGNTGGSGSPLTLPFGSGNSGLGSGNSGSGNSGSGDSSASQAVDAGLVDIDTSLYQDGEAAGTGIVLTSNGYVLTNNHVITGATTVKATDIGNGQTFTAQVVGYDRTHDVAVIKLENASGLTTAKLGNSNKVSVGDDIVGVGNAGGSGGTPSSAAGQVTALNQSITADDQSNGTSEQLTGLIQTNADIQPGDSGGALVNSSGQVVGMDTAASEGFSFQTDSNQGFAIPINEALTYANEIRSGQATSTVHIGATAFLGVEVDSPASGNGSQSAQSGAVLNSVIQGGPAAAAGLAGGDTITALGGSSVDSANTLTELISHYHPGDSVGVTWLDSSGQSHTATVHLGTGPAA